MPSTYKWLFYGVAQGYSGKLSEPFGQGREMAIVRRASLRALILSVLALLLAQAGVALAAGDVGYRDFSFNATSVVAPTGEKPQSKLWVNDGTWWGSLFNKSTEEFHIYRYDRAAHTWSDSGTLIDERNSSKADTL